MIVLAKYASRRRKIWKQNKIKLQKLELKELKELKGEAKEKDKDKEKKKEDKKLLNSQ